MASCRLFCRFRAPLLVLCLLCAALGGCAFDFWGLLAPPPVYSNAPVPAEVFEPEILAAFMRANPEPMPATIVTVSPEGKVEPGGELLPDDYQPKSYAAALHKRLDLRSFPNLLFVPDRDEPVTHASPVWSVQLMEKAGCTFSASYASVTYRVVATFDYDGKGNRDWLVLSTQQLSRDNGLVLVLWLLVQNPQPTGPMSARLLGVEERRGLGGSGVIMEPEAARKKIVELRAALKFPPLPQ